MQFYVSANVVEDDEGKVSIRKAMRKEQGSWKIDYLGEKPETPLLDTINYPKHMKNLSIQDLEQLAAELRAEIVYTISKMGWHLSSSLRVLGVVELAVTLHHVFDTLEDKIMWDVGHQVRLEGQMDFCWLCEQPQGVGPLSAANAHLRFFAVPFQVLIQKILNLMM